MFSDQAGKCQICRLVFVLGVNGGPVPNTDHCHKTGKIRGLLCGSCNRMIGLAKDSADTLRRAAEYIEKTSCVEESNLLG